MNHIEDDNLGIISLTSVTYALKAQKILEQNSIKTHLSKTTEYKFKQGCGYILKIHGNLEKAVNILKSNNIKVLDYYLAKNYKASTN